MNFRPLLDLNFWFGLTPPPLLPVFRTVTIVLFGLLTALAIVLVLLRQFRKLDAIISRHLGKWVSWSLFFAVTGWLIFLFNEQRIAFFSSRFWYVIWAVFLIWWGINVLRDARTVSARRAKIAEREAFQKYLPKKKR